jgi:hypothetical protein
VSKKLKRAALLSAGIRYSKPQIRGNDMSDAMLTTNELAARLGIGREAARKLMQNTTGVITLPPVNGTGKNETRRMPGNVFEQLVIKLSGGSTNVTNRKGPSKLLETAGEGSRV